MRLECKSLNALLGVLVLKCSHEKKIHVADLPLFYLMNLASIVSSTAYLIKNQVFAVDADAKPQLRR